MNKVLIEISKGITFTGKQHFGTSQLELEFSLFLLVFMNKNMF